MNKILQGDCLIKLKELEDNSVDSIVTDPPYELGFMGKAWDSTGIANNKEMWGECLRVLKPGGHLLAFSGTRTYHRMASAIEDAGFEVRDMVEWIYGSGFPKSLNIGKAVDKLHGNEREVTGINEDYLRRKPNGMRTAGANTYNYSKTQQETNPVITKGTSEWEGWGTALKPAHEPICMARKPLAEKTVAENCLKYGTGGINIDESRVGTEGGGGNGLGSHFDRLGNTEPLVKHSEDRTDTIGRFPANLIHDNSEEVRECFPESKSGGGNKNIGNRDGIFGKLGKGNGDGIGNDSGSASRFFKSIIYQAKASKSERNKGCEGLESQDLVRQGLAGEHNNPKHQNNHPTVKPIALMEYLIKMVTPKGGVVLDPFAGSGSTLVAAKQNGYGYIGIEMTEEYIPIMEARLKL